MSDLYRCPQCGALAAALEFQPDASGQGVKVTLRCTSPDCGHMFDAVHTAQDGGARARGGGSESM